MSDLSYAEQIISGLVDDTTEEDQELSGEDQELSAVKVGKRPMPKTPLGTKTPLLLRNSVLPKPEFSATSQRNQVIERVSQLPKEIQDGILNNHYQLSDKVHYAVVDFSNWSNQDIIKPDAGKSTGLNSFSQGKISNWFLCQGIKVVYDSVSETGEYIDDMPATVLNGDMNLSVNTREKFDNLPIMRIISHNGYPADRDFNTLWLNNPKWFEALKDVTSKLNTAGAQTTGYLKVMFIGTEVKPN